MKWLAALLMLTAPASAQGDLSVNADDIRACHANTPVGARYPDCLGAAASACQTQPGGGNTYGIVSCITSELEVWDELLNSEYQATLAAFQKRDGDADHASLVDALRTAQRAWIAFRDADCTLTWTIYQGGTLRSIAAANCRLTETASRALHLRDLREN